MKDQPSKKDQPSMRDQVVTALTGLAMTFASPSDLIKSGGSLVKGALNWKLHESYSREVNHFMEKGGIKDDYFEDENAQDGLIAMIQCLEGDKSIQIKKFKAIKQIFLNAAKADDKSGKASIYIETVNSLSTEEIVFLSTIYSVLKSKDFPRWHNENSPIADHRAKKYIHKSIDCIVGHSTSIQTINHGRSVYNKLRDKFILRSDEIRHDFENDESFLLSDFGLDLCKYIEGDIDSPVKVDSLAEAPKDKEINYGAIV